MVKSQGNGREVRTRLAFVFAERFSGERRLMCVCVCVQAERGGPVRQRRSSVTSAARQLALWTNQVTASRTPRPQPPPFRVPSTERPLMVSSDCKKTACRAPDLTDQQLMQVAKRMGKEWKIVAICYLGLSKQDLEEIESAKDEDVIMLKFNMLDRWRRRQPKGEAGIQELNKCLKDNDDVPNEVIAVLAGERFQPIHIQPIHTLRAEENAFTSSQSF